MSRLFLSILAFASFWACFAAQTALADLTVEQRRELNDLRRSASKVTTHLRKKEVSEAATLMSEVESRFDEILAEAGVEKTDRRLQAILREFEKQRTALEKAQAIQKESEPVSFLKEIAPLINEKCVRCHGANNPRANLRLDSFAAWGRGGNGGVLLIPGYANRSLLMSRLLSPDDRRRMPSQADPLAHEELQTIIRWINQGAKFDGENSEATLADLLFEREKAELDIEIPKPKGTETVHFTRDIAPWMSNLCLNCHNSNRQSGGLSVETFYDIMKGGESGVVILPGDMENSRLFRLVGGLELPRMPQGQARITRKNYEDLKKWFEEGNTFDGEDPRTRIRTYVASAATTTTNSIASMTDEEFRQHRLSRSQDQLRRTIPNDKIETVTSDRFLVLGNLPGSQLQDVLSQAETQLTSLQKTFGESGTPWRGRLAIFVLKDRFSYDEFQQVVEQRRPEKDVNGHSRVTANQEDAYVVLLQPEGSSDNSEQQAELIEHLAGAYLQKSGRQLPAWIVGGIGKMLAESVANDRQATRKAEQLAISLIPTLSRPEEFFADRAFSPDTASEVGYSMVKYLIGSGGPAKLSQLVKSLQEGENINEALRSTYDADAATIATGYLASLKKR